MLTLIVDKIIFETENLDLIEKQNLNMKIRIKTESELKNQNLN